MLILLILFYVLFPVVIIYACQKFSALNKVGTVAVAYGAGLILGNLGILPPEAAQAQNIVTMVTVPLSLPLLLFSSNLKSWFRLAPKTMLAMVLGFSGVISTLLSAAWLFRPWLPQTWQVAGMLLGDYVGGTPNLVSVGTALHVDSSLLVLTNAYDIVISTTMFLVLLFVAPSLLQRFLPPFRGAKQHEAHLDTQAEFESYAGVLARATMPQLLGGILLSALILAISGWLSTFVPPSATTATVILSVTTLGVLASLIPTVNKLPHTFQAGLYLILVFSFTVASMAKFEHFQDTNLALPLLIITAVYGSFLSIAALAALFRIDADTTLITITALIFAPPIVPVIAGVIKNKAVILSGLTIGIIGYALGNYLGIFLAYLIASW